MAPNDRILIATLLAGDFDKVPTMPQPGIGRFRPEIADLIRKRVPDDSCAWLVASSDNGRSISIRMCSWELDRSKVATICWAPQIGCDPSWSRCRSPTINRLRSRWN